jgi:hypothetical protein
MAVKEKEKAKLPPAKRVVDVSRKHSDEDILALEAKDYALRFNERDFRELDESTIEKLSSANARDYFITKGAHDALAKNAKRSALGFEGIEIVDPLKTQARNKLANEGIPKGFHACWKRPDEVEDAKKNGYVMVPKDVKTPGASSTSSSHVITAKDGKDDLVLMMVPQRLFLQHLEANAQQSRRNAGATIKELSRKVAETNRNLEGVELPNLEETTSTDEVPISVDRAS